MSFFSFCKRPDHIRLLSRIRTSNLLYSVPTTFLAQMPETSIMEPMMALMISALDTKKNTHTTESPVNVMRQ